MELEINSLDKNFSATFTTEKDNPDFLHIESFANGFGFNLMDDEIEEFISMLIELKEKIQSDAH